MGTLTYSYGAKPPTVNNDIVDSQISLAHRYYNKLVSLERDRRAVVESMQDNDDVKREINERRNALTRAYRAECGVYWGTYLTVEAAVQAASRTREGPRFHRWDWGGTVAVQIINGMPAEQLLSGEDTRARIIGTGKRRELWLRVGSEGREPVWSVFPIVYHREIPATSKIKWVRCVRRKVGTKLKWSAQFVLCADDAEIAHPAPTSDVIGVDIGWRVVAEGIRVAYWYDGEGHGELVIPQRLIDRYVKTEDLRSIRDKHFNTAKDLLSSARKTSCDRWPWWLVERTGSLHQWRSTARLAALVISWREKRFDGDDELFGSLESWRRQDKHLLEWEANQRENVLRARREIYRLFARQVARYRHIVLEDINLRRFAEKPGPEDEPDRPVTKAARPNRFKACLSDLLTAIVQAGKRAGCVVSEAPAEYTTMTCSWCGHVGDFDAALKIEHTCAVCGTTWDQDHNAARNLFRAAEWCKDPGRRSKRKTVADTGKTAAELRRERAAETKRVAARKRAEKSNGCGVVA
jgi:hypothetical protein